MNNKISGIYRITNKINGKCYIGSTTSLYGRHYEHFHNKKSNIHLQRAMDKYGKENFLWEVLLECPKEELLKWEQYYIDQEDFNNLYNIIPQAGNLLGYKHSEEAKKKISEGNKGKARSEKERRRLQIVNLGRHPSQETRLKISQAGQGRLMSTDNRLAMSKRMTNRLVSDSTKEKLRTIALGKHPSEVTRRKMSLTRTGLRATESAKENMRRGQRNRPPISEETRLRQSQSAKLRHSKQREKQNE